MDGHLQQLIINIDSRQLNLTFVPSVRSLVSPHVTTVLRNSGAGGKLNVGWKPNSCHYQHRSPEVYAAVSTCDNTLVSRHFIILIFAVNALVILYAVWKL